MANSKHTTDIHAYAHKFSIYKCITADLHICYLMLEHHQCVFTSF